MEQTDKIVIKKTEPKNFDKILAFEKENSQFVAQYSIAEHKEILEKEYHLSIFEKDKNSLVGYIILVGISNANKSVEFRRIVVSKKGHGYGKDAIKLIKKICFNHMKVEEIWLDVYEDNVRAKKIYKELGFLKNKIKVDSNNRRLWVMTLKAG